MGLHRDSAVLPYDDLPLVAGLGLPHAWDLLDPELGSLSFLTGERRLAAARLVHLGEAIGLNPELGEIDPPLYGRARLKHEIIEVGRNTLEDVLHSFNPQASSQWDGLGHVRAREFGFFGGEDGPPAAGIAAWARNGIAGRGVLLDVPRWAADTGRAWDPLSGQVVTASDLLECAAHVDVEILAGDILCVRLGWMSAYRELSRTGNEGTSVATTFSGLAADEAMARFVWNSQLAAIGADNPALEAAPGDPSVGSLHRRLIPLLGTAVAELLDLDRLAERCAEQRRATFLFVAVPIPLVGGVSSPSNALALL